jgi:ligand-binding sensor domain-containing protein/signal transduction histidine kinase
MGSATHFRSAFLSLLLTPALAFSLDPSLAISQYVRQHWQVEQGLPQNYVTSITQAPDGALLIGTSGGVARFEGSSFTPIVLDAESGLTREWINTLLVDEAGTTWIGSRDAGLFRQSGTTAAKLVEARVAFSAVSHGNRGDMIGAGGGLWRYHAGKWSLQLDGIASADLNWQGLLPLADGTILVGAANGLQAVRGGAATLLLPDTGPAGRVLSLRRGRDGAIFAGTTTGLFQLTFSGARVSALPIEGVPGPVVSIVEDRDGLVWAATWGRGLFRANPRPGATRVSSWTNRGGLLDDFVHTVYEDSEGSIWVGTRGGLSRLTAGILATYGPEEGLDGQFISTVAGTADGSLWLGSWRSGLHRFKDNAFQHVNLGEPDLTTLVRSFAIATDHSFFMSDWHKLRHFDGTKWHNFTRKELGHASNANAILIAPDGTKWIGTTDGLFQYPPGPIRAPGRPRLLQRSVNCLLRAKEGAIWAGTDHGLVALRGESIVELPGLPHSSVTALAEDSQSRIWAATRAGGLSLVSGGALRNFDSRHGLPTLPVLAMIGDQRGAYWLSTASGLYEIPPGGLRELINGRVNPVRYDQQDGMRTVECQNVGQPAAWLDSAGSLWFTTVRGALRVLPRRAQPLAPPKVTVESSLNEAGNHVVRCSAIRLSTPHRLEFRYRLRSGEWIAMGAERNLQFSGLGAGSHLVEISARDTGGDWGPPSSVVLVQPPLWYETWWFRGLLALTAALLLWLIHFWRMLIVRGRYAAVLAERNRIAREWHDTLLAGFSAISWQLDAALGRLRDKPETAVESVDLARTMVRHYRVEARRVISDLRNDQPESIDLPRSIRQALEEVGQGSQVEMRSSVEGEFPVLPVEMSQNILRIAQEAAVNAFHHASPTRIEAHLRFARGTVEVSIRDDGRGFDPLRVEPGHFGLAIMRERAERFGGKVTVESAAGGGTIVSARIPWKP